MLSLQEISDRFEIQDLLVAYSDAVDAKDWDAYEAVFTPDAFIDYTAMGGAAGNPKEIRAYLERAMELFSSTQHMVGNTVLEIDGDTARARTICFNPMEVAGTDGEVLFCGLWYRDVIVRTPDGWKFKERVEERSYFHNVPADFAPADTTPSS